MPLLLPPLLLQPQRFLLRQILLMDSHTRRCGGRGSSRRRRVTLVQLLNRVLSSRVVSINSKVVGVGVGGGRGGGRRSDTVQSAVGVSSSPRDGSGGPVAQAPKVSEIMGDIVERRCRRTLLYSRQCIKSAYFSGGRGWRRVRKGEGRGSTGCRSTARWGPGRYALAHRSPNTDRYDAVTHTYTKTYGHSG